MQSAGLSPRTRGHSSHAFDKSANCWWTAQRRATRRRGSKRGGIGAGRVAVPAPFFRFNILIASELREHCPTRVRGGAGGPRGPSDLFLAWGDAPGVSSPVLRRPGDGRHGAGQGTGHADFSDHLQPDERPPIVGDAKVHFWFLGKSSLATGGDRSGAWSVSASWSGRAHAHRLRLGDYRVYFERHPLGLVVHRILNRNSLKDFLFRSGPTPTGEDEALNQTRTLGDDRSRAPERIEALRRPEGEGAGASG